MARDRKITGEAKEATETTYLVLVHHRLVGCKQGPDVAYVGTDDLAALVEFQSSVCDDVTCISLHAWQAGAPISDPVMLFP